MQDGQPAVSQLACCPTRKAENEKAENEKAENKKAENEKKAEKAGMKRKREG